MTVPLFTADGLLPVGDYAVTLEQLRASRLVTGQGLGSRTWDRAWCGELVDNLEKLARQLWQAGVDRVFADGSFAEAKDHPNDIDGYFECELVNFSRLVQDLNSHDPEHVWDWSNRPIDPVSLKPHPRMWHAYRVELYPHFTDYPQLCGIPDQFGNDQFFPSAFRHSRRAHRQKGIMQIVRSALTFQFSQEVTP
ncbi:MAG: hypothetical protein H0V51_08240 [Chloroflexi bacterium]|nr:hypothetical protein [Chloroflexota bacterium]